MNPNTGHLIEILKETGPSFGMLAKLGYEEIPPELAEEAARQLAGQRETYIDLSSASPLSQWAADQRRRQEKKKARNRRIRKMLKEQCKRR